ncbi:MAG: hybrid sensor histidine kinase/response regulator, partial [Pseudomonadales bacterium]|nr:hybrid sensor histidine kinase/response regulator [Pseudomonadales bacterium]
MSDFFTNLFSNTNFLPHGHCYMWTPEILWLHVISDLIIAIAYYSIPLALAIILFKRKAFPFKWLIGLFAAFIILCGTTHIIGIVTQW